MVAASLLQASNQVTANNFGAILLPGMTDQERPDDARPELKKDAVLQKNGALTPATSSDLSDKAKTAKPLTPDEQMALFEKDLKENDWGHQPC